VCRRGESSRATHSNMPSAKRKRETQAAENVAGRNGQNVMFVTVTGLNQPPDPDVQRTIRQHAMKVYRRRSRRRNEYQYLDITPLLETQHPSQLTAPESRAQERFRVPCTDLVNPTLNVEVGASIVNPFAAPTQQMTPRNRELFNHCALCHPLHLSSWLIVGQCSKTRVQCSKL
jgi:hypothetical protein